MFCSTNKLVSDRNKHLWSEEQQKTHDLIKSLHDSGMGYRSNSYWLNEHGYKTPRGHEFKNTHVFSILKKKRIADERMEKRFEPTIENLEWYKWLIRGY